MWYFVTFSVRGKVLKWLSLVFREMVWDLSLWTSSTCSTLRRECKGWPTAFWYFPDTESMLDLPQWLETHTSPPRDNVRTDVVHNALWGPRDRTRGNCSALNPGTDHTRSRGGGGGCGRKAGLHLPSTLPEGWPAWDRREWGDVKTTRVTP